MKWTAIVPLKQPGTGKTRLAHRLDPAGRMAVVEAMLDHVVATLRVTPHIGRIELLCGDRPSGWSADWRRDEGRGLNRELDAALDAIGPEPALVLHADLPLLQPDDVTALLNAAERTGLAIAPDWHDSGTNALALSDRRAFSCRFGADSFRLHRAEAGSDHAVVRRSGLGRDCDTPHDLDQAIAAGFRVQRSGWRDDHPMRRIVRLPGSDDKKLP